MPRHLNSDRSGQRSYRIRLLVVRVVLADVSLHELGELARLGRLGVFARFGEHLHNLLIQFVGLADQSFLLMVAGCGRRG